VAQIKQKINEWGIDTLLTHWNGDSHQDHVSAYGLALAAGRP
jgi:LmbE family N-acetylglucosaminyl deacetylase